LPPGRPLGQGLQAVAQFEPVLAVAAQLAGQAGQTGRRHALAGAAQD
jgi:hypothetical protein